MIRINNRSFSLNKNLAAFSGLFFLLGTVLLFTLQKLTPLIGHITYYCQSVLVDAKMIPIPYYLNTIPFIFLSIILAISIIKFSALYLRMQFLKLKLKRSIIIKHSANKLVNHLGLKGKVILVKSDKQFAFCLGVRNPKIYFSTSLFYKLSMKELEAVLRHEQYHLENHDSLTLIVASVAHSLLPFFPLVSDLINKYRVDREIQADKFAVNKIGDSYPLVSALKKLLAFPTNTTVAVAAIADQDTLEPRIYTLLNKPYIRSRFGYKHLFMTLFSSLLLVTIIAIPVNAKELHHEEHDVMMLCTDGECMNICTTQKNLNKLYSEMPNVNNVSKSNALHSFTPGQ